MITRPSVGAVWTSRSTASWIFSFKIGFHIKSTTSTRAGMCCKSQRFDLAGRIGRTYHKRLLFKRAVSCLLKQLTVKLKLCKIHFAGAGKSKLIIMKLCRSAALASLVLMNFSCHQMFSPRNVVLRGTFLTADIQALIGRYRRCSTNAGQLERWIPHSTVPSMSPRASASTQLEAAFGCLCLRFNDYSNDLRGLITTLPSSIHRTIFGIFSDSAAVDRISE